MPNFLVTRKQLLVGLAPVVAAGPLTRFALGEDLPSRTAAGHEGMSGHAGTADRPDRPRRDDRRGGPRAGGRDALDHLLYPPPPLPASPGRVREYVLTALDREIEVAAGVSYPAWTYNGTVPGPVLRATEDDLLRVRFANAGSHPHTIHFHGIHPPTMDGVFEVVEPGGSFVYEFEARPAGFHPYHCHSTPLKKHIHKGLYGALIIDPEQPRPDAQELVMVMNGYDTDGDGANNFYTVNGRSFYYARIRSRSAARSPSACTWRT